MLRLFKVNILSHNARLTAVLIITGLRGIKEGQPQGQAGDITVDMGQAQSSWGDRDRGNACPCPKVVAMLSFIRREQLI